MLKPNAPAYVGRCSFCAIIEHLINCVIKITKRNNAFINNKLIAYGNACSVYLLEASL